jgi:selenide,water dikinase
MINKENIRLTEYSHGAGCGCKISPAVLHDILKDSNYPSPDKNLLVGNEEKDDAAVLDLGNGTALISTTDFFMPIVDDPFDFGRIASVNAISDIYAMGGKPILAISILAWPIDKLGSEIAKEVVEGARSVCSTVGISLAGGHSIDNPEPVFGLSVNGTIKKENIKKNSNAKIGSTLFLTKEIGVGIITTAKKKQIVSEVDYNHAIKSMLKLNSIGEKLAVFNYVQSMTDVTGFGLLGHLVEICEGSLVSAELDFKKIPLMPNLEKYIGLSAVPGGTIRNWKSYGEKVKGVDEFRKSILSDPQTSGGLLIAIEEGYEKNY